MSGMKKALLRDSLLAAPSDHTRSALALSRAKTAARSGPPMLIHTHTPQIPNGIWIPANQKRRRALSAEGAALLLSLKVWERVKPGGVCGAPWLRAKQNKAAEVLRRLAVPPY